MTSRFLTSGLRSSSLRRFALAAPVPVRWASVATPTRFPSVLSISRPQFDVPKEQPPSATPQPQVVSRPVTLDLPYDARAKATQQGAWFDKTRREWCCSPDNSELIDKFGTQHRVYLEVPQNSFGDAQAGGAFWAPEYMQWYAHPAAPNFKKLCEKYQVKRIPLDVPFELVKEAMESGLRWCPNHRTWYVLENDDRREELVQKFNGRRIYFRVPFEQKDRARELGCQYDAVCCGWYAVSGSENLDIIRENYDETPRPTVRGGNKRWGKQ